MENLNHKISYSNQEIKTECQCCSKIFLRKRKHIEMNIKRNRKNYCSKECRNNSRKQEKLKFNCLNCNKEIFRYKNQVVKSGKVFCNAICNAVYHNSFRKIQDTTLKCDNCKNDFIRPLYNVHRNNKHNFCCIKCSTSFKKEYKEKYKKPRIILNCLYCKKEVEKTKNDIRKSKTGKIFCSKSCRMTHQNYNNPKKYGCRRSKAETFLCNLIKKEFPELKILENDRTILDSKLEIDIYIPDKKIAIELNGPVHYFPIYGDERLKKCQNKDIIKQEEIQKKNINLLVIDISRITSKKQTEKFLDEYFLNFIKPIISN